MTVRSAPPGAGAAGLPRLRLDNRGTARRGLAFEAAVIRNLGRVEVQDQVAGVRWLAANVPEVDPHRVGIYGWSYGGYMSLMCLARAPESFSAAAAGAPRDPLGGLRQPLHLRALHGPSPGQPGRLPGRARC